MKAFRAPKETIGHLDAEAAAAIAAAAADITLVLDDGGVIRDMALSNEQLALDLGGDAGWIGRPWSGTVLEDSRGKVDALVAEATPVPAPRWRHVNHAGPRGAAVPVLYSTVRFRPNRIVAFGRDLRPVAQLQQRLVEAQQSMERDYSRLRQAEARYRLLFQMSSESVLMVDAASLRVAETNPAAARLFGSAAKGGIGRPFLELLAPESHGPVQVLLAGIRAGGRADEVRARLARDPGGEVLISASPLRQDKSAMLLVRIALPAGTAEALPRAKTELLRLVESAPDAFVVTGQDGRIVAANPAFLEMAQLASEEQARGQPLERWLGRPGVEFEVLVANLRNRGPVRLFATSLHGDHGATVEVEVSAINITHGGTPGFGFAIRDVGPRPVARPGTDRALPRSVEQLTELVGRVPLKDLVREATDLIERLAIEAALGLTNDNRASAAEMLGLSRQSLYVKLRRYGLGDLATDHAEEG